jgi:hypothetical protein
MQPAFMQALRQSQQAWIISQQALSPLVQVMHTPLSIIVHWQLHIAMLHWHIIIPFIMQHRLHIPPAIILHICCKMAAAISSSQVHLTFMPPAHFSIVIVQCGTMHIPGAIAGMPDICPMGVVPDIPVVPIIADRSNIMVLDITELLVRTGHAAARTGTCPRERAASFIDRGSRVRPSGDPVSSADNQKASRSRVGTDRTLHSLALRAGFCKSLLLQILRLFQRS